MLGPGDPVPSFHAHSLGNPRYAFDSVAGRYIVLSFIASSRVPGVERFYADLCRDAGPFDDRFASLFLVSSDAADASGESLRERYPGIRIFIDADRAMARRFGCLREGVNGAEQIALTTWILDPGLRVLKVLPVEDAATHGEAIRNVLRDLPSPAEEMDSPAPVLIVPNILEPEFCRALLDHAHANGLEESGYMKTDPATGQTVMVVDHAHKRRMDCSIEDEGLRQGLQARIIRRLVPQIERAFQFRATRMERYIISCYDAETGGYFRPHKDNTTLGTAHRRFAVSIGLDADSYEGGDLRFPEFGRRTYRPPTGGAVVFSCSLLHEATPVTKGRRFAVLPFLYDDAAAAIRLANAQHLQDEALRESVIASVTAKPGSSATQ